jgi:S1-C subfamily serine protease
VIVSLGGHAVTSAAIFRSAIDAYHPGNKTSVVWADLAGQTHTATVVFATGPAG